MIVFATLVIQRQVQFLQKGDLGFNQDQLLVIQAPGGNLPGNFQVVRQELMKVPGVSEVSVSGNIPGRGLGNNLISLKNDRSKATDMMLLQVDDRFLNTYDIEMVAGRNISELVPEDTAGDAQHVLINEAALKAFGWSSPREALGQEFDGGWGKVIGVIRNFHFTSLQTGIMPLELYFAPRNFKYVTVKLTAGEIPRTLEEVKRSWASLMPAHPFDYFFLDEEFSRQYVFENRMKKLFTVFSWIGIFIASLGLFGLTTFALQRRTREIGVKKVLGASVLRITKELAFRFLQWIILAGAIALPLGWWMMNRWLTGFAYRIEIGGWMILLAGLIAFSVAAIPVVWVTLRAAKVNPVNSLKTE
jgi:putative ABC transport system permease protein